MIHTAIFIIGFIIVGLVSITLSKKWSRFRMVKKGDACGLFIDNGGTVDTFIDRVFKVDTNKVGDTIKIYTESGKTYTLKDYMLGNLNLLEDD